MSTEITTKVDDRGLPGAIELLPKQASDKAAVEEILAAYPTPGDVVTDRGYDPHAILDLITARGGRGHIILIQHDSQPQRPVDRGIYRKRNLVERFFAS